jgi:hypothetical protein
MIEMLNAVTELLAIQSFGLVAPHRNGYSQNEFRDFHGITGRCIHTDQCISQRGFVYEIVDLAIRLAILSKPPLTRFLVWQQRSKIVIIQYHGRYWWWNNIGGLDPSLELFKLLSAPNEFVSPFEHRLEYS